MINDLETQFQSGVNMVLMMGLLEGYYIPHYLWHYTPKNFEERVRMSVGNTKGFVGGGGALLKGRKTTTKGLSNNCLVPGSTEGWLVKKAERVQGVMLSSFRFPDSFLISQLLNLLTHNVMMIMMLSLACLVGQCEASFQTDGGCWDTTRES